MAANSKIEWTDATFNCWRGCTKVSAGCAHCYAETLSGRNPKTLGVWGPNGTRVVASESMWKEPEKWNRDAATANQMNAKYFPGMPPERPRVFCASLADVFEDWQGIMVDAHETQLCRCRECDTWMYFTERECKCRNDRLPVPLTMADVRRRLFDLIDRTPNLDWLLLTKRPENILDHLEAALILEQGGNPSDVNFFAEHGESEPKTSAANMLNEWIAGDPPRTVWLGTSVENQQAKSRIDTLRTIPAAVRFLSVEPLLEDLGKLDLIGIHWVIVGGESGPGARPCRVEWIRDIVKQCKAAGVPVFVKQLGSKPIWEEPDRTVDPSLPQSLWRQPCIDRKGGDPDEWPEDLRVRELPTAQGAAA